MKRRQPIATGLMLLTFGSAGALLPVTVAADEVTRVASVDRPVEASPIGLLPGARLVGEGTLTWFGLRIYQARLYTSAPSIPHNRPVDAEFALELEYARSLKGADIATRSAEEIERLGRGDAASRARWLDRMRTIFPDVRRGDRITGVNRPGRGAGFYLNGKPLGSVDETEFAEAFFAIWFDPQTTDPSLRTGLLARSGPAS